MLETEHKVPIEQLKEANIEPVKGVKLVIKSKVTGKLANATITKVEKDFVTITTKE